ncbi:MAG: ABC transporter substrate-binding protein [Deltaproteobacteria bacterium]|nr:ABC transporter substrate-binding protein [Deltaproteobacteria bacterium]
MKKILTTVFIMMFLLVAVTGCQQKEETVKIGHLRITMSLPTYVALEKGFFADQGLKVELVPFNSGTTVIDALVAGRIDANCGSSVTGHWFAAQNAPDRFKVFLLFGSTDNKGDKTFVVVVRKDSSIKDLKDLKDKKIGTFPGATSVSLARLAVGTQTDPKGVIFTEIPPPNLVPALASRQIDAFFSPEPFGMIAASKGLGKYLMKSPLTLLNLENGVPGGAFSFNAKFLKERPKAAKKVKIAIEKALDYIRENDKEVRPILAKHTGLPEPVAMRLPFDEWIKMKEFNKNAGQEYFDILYEDGAYKQKVDTTKLYYE